MRCVWWPCGTSVAEQQQWTMKSCELAQFYCCSIVLLKEDTNEYLKQVFRTQHQGNPGLLLTLSILITEKLKMKKPLTTSIARRVYITMPMEPETFRELFSRLPSAPNLLRVTKFSVPVHELDMIVPAGWSFNTLKTSTTCQLQPDKPIELALLEQRKVCYDHSRCLHCQGGNGAPIACKDVLRRILYRSILLKVPFYQEQNKEAQKKPKERTRLTWAKPRVFNKQTHLQLCVTLFFRLTLLQPLCKKLLPASIAMITWPLLNCTKWLILLIVRLRLSASLKLL